MYFLNNPIRYTIVDPRNVSWSKWFQHVKVTSSEANSGMLTINIVGLWFEREIEAIIITCSIFGIVIRNDRHYFYLLTKIVMWFCLLQDSCWDVSWWVLVRRWPLRVHPWTRSDHCLPGSLFHYGLPLWVCYLYGSKVMGCWFGMIPYVHVFDVNRFVLIVTKR